MKIKVLEVDQWSAGHYKGQDFDDVIQGIEKERTGDARTVDILGIKTVKVKEVGEKEVPFIGIVWLVPDQNNQLIQYKARLDSSG